MLIGKRFIDGDRLVRLIEDRIGSAPEVARWLKRQPRSPQLVSSQGAAKILGVLPPHLSRLGDRLPKPVEIEGTRAVAYVKSEIEALAAEIRQEKKAKQKSKTKAKEAVR